MRKILLYSLMVVIVLFPILTGCSQSDIMIRFSDKDQPIMVGNSSDTLSQVLANQGLDMKELQAHYVPSIPWNAQIESHSHILLTCRCHVHLQVGGKELGTFVTTKTTVGAFLQEQKVKLTAWDEINASLKPAALTDPIADNMVIAVDQIEQKIVKKVELVNFTTMQEKSDSLAKGDQAIKKPGQKGENIYQMVILYRNGQPEQQVNKKLVASIQPVSEVVIIGTNPNMASSSSRFQTFDLATSATMTVQATAYTSTGHHTATGTWPEKGTIAADPRVFPMGTHLYVPGYGWGKVEDTGGAIKGKIIDLFLGTNQECIQWGRRTITVHYVKP